MVTQLRKKDIATYWFIKLRLEINSTITKLSDSGQKSCLVNAVTKRNNNLACVVGFSVTNCPIASQKIQIISTSRKLNNQSRMKYLFLSLFISRCE